MACSWNSVIGIDIEKSESLSQHELHDLIESRFSTIVFTEPGFGFNEDASIDSSFGGAENRQFQSLRIELHCIDFDVLQLADIIEHERRNLLGALQFKEIGPCESSEPFEIRRKQ